MAKSASRPQRWHAALAKIEEGLDELETLKEEYAEWQSNMPENLADSPLGEKLQAIEEFDLDSIRDTCEDMKNAELPRGFGKD